MCKKLLITFNYFLFCSQPRSESIATYAICNFANFGSVGMNLGAMGALAPERKKDLSSVAMRALMGGCMSSYMTACVAGKI